MIEKYFTEEHYLLRDMIRDFTNKEILPLSKKIDNESMFPMSIIKNLSELGLMGIPWDAKYNGGGMDTLSLVIAIEEMGKVCASTAATVMAHTSLGSGPIAIFGTESQKKKYLAKLATGEFIGSFGLTEPNAGSDAGNTQTTAKLVNDKYIINGQKIFCTNAGYADIIIITARILDEAKNNSIGAFIVEKGSKGLTLGKPEKKMGWKGSDTRSVFFKNVSVPKDNILGTPSKGFKQFLQTLTGGRITIGALSLGTAQGAYKEALRYSNERIAFGERINQFQAISFKLADMATRIEAAKHLVYFAAWKKDHFKNVIKEAAMAKLFSSETAMFVTNEAIQIHGGYGYINDYNVERFYRDSKILEIGEGTSEIQRIIISREILKNINHI